MNKLTEEYFLEKTIVCAEDAKASFSNMAQMELDQETKDQYKNAVKDISKHIEFFNSRLLYLKQMSKSGC